MIVDDAPPAAGERSDIGQFAMVPVWMCSMGLTGGEFKTLVSLLTWVNRESSEAWPRVREIAERAAVSESTAERALARLRDLGMIRTTQWHRPDGSIGGSSYYVFMVRPADRAPALATDDKSATPPSHQLPAPAEAEGECPLGTEPIWPREQFAVR